MGELETTFTRGIKAKSRACAKHSTCERRTLIIYIGRQMRETERTQEKNTHIQPENHSILIVFTRARQNRRVYDMAKDVIKMRIQLVINNKAYIIIICVSNIRVEQHM